MTGLMKQTIKQWIYAVPLLKQSLIGLHGIGGRRPWSAGYSFYKYAFIREVIERGLADFRADRLPDGYGRGLDDRAVEYPWFFSRLADGAATILDAGSSLNHAELLRLPLWADRRLVIASLGFDMICRNGLCPTYVKEDLRATSFKDGMFDAVVSISTVEHIGMDNTFLYTRDIRKKENDRYAYLKAVAEFRRIVRPGGDVFITVPFGAYRDHGWFQIFDEGMIDRLIEAFGPAGVQETYYRYTGGQWTVTDRAACRQSRYFDIHREKHLPAGSPAASESVACLQLTKSGG